LPVRETAPMLQACRQLPALGGSKTCAGVVENPSHWKILHMQQYELGLRLGIGLKLGEGSGLELYSYITRISRWDKFFTTHCTVNYSPGGRSELSV